MILVQMFGFSIDSGLVPGRGIPQLCLAPGRVSFREGFSPSGLHLGRERICSRLGLGLVHEVCEEVHTNGQIGRRMLPIRRSEKWVAYALNFYMLIRHCLGLWLIACTRIMV